MIEADFFQRLLENLERIAVIFSALLVVADKLRRK